MFEGAPERVTSVAKFLCGIAIASYNRLACHPRSRQRRGRLGRRRLQSRQVFRRGSGATATALGQQHHRGLRCVRSRQSGRSPRRSRPCWGSSSSSSRTSSHNQPQKLSGEIAAITWRQPANHELNFDVVANIDGYRGQTCRLAWSVYDSQGHYTGAASTDALNLTPERNEDRGGGLIRIPAPTTAGQYYVVFTLLLRTGLSLTANRASPSTYPPRQQRAILQA
jgi:hypothetical protein